jgi:hypothetical protein
MLHALHDAVSLEIARRIAGGLPTHPEWLTLAKSNLHRWSTLNRDTPALLRCYQEWRDLLEKPTGEISAALQDPTETGQRLRQNSPFTGALTPAEVWQIKRRIHETNAA